MKKDKTINEEIMELQKRISVAKKNGVVYMDQSGDETDTCVLRKNSYENSEVLIATGEDKKLHTLISLELLNHLIASLKKTQEENFNLKLEKTIWKYVPVDFSDAWAVAISEVQDLVSKEKKDKTTNINLNHLVKNIKKKHPNLFLNIDDFLPGEFKQLN